MKKITTFLGIVLAALTLSGVLAAAGGVALDTVPVKTMEGHDYYLGYNLHADMPFDKISSVNYQLQGELLPWGTKVRIVRVMRNFLVFDEVGRNHRFSYEFHRKTRRTVPLVEHIRRVFRENVDDLKRQVAAMSDVDKDGIYEGRAKPGMSREGVLVAIGYPPEFANRDALMTEHAWVYWVNRHERMVVSFNRHGRVSRISGDY